MRQPKSRALAQSAADRVASRFPLVRRAHLTCPDLGTRIAEVHGHAHASQEHEDPADRIHRACAAWNLAALIAADCGMLELAADLCRRQFRLLHTAWPATGRVAIASLQPLVNLARLTHRSGDPNGAYEALLALSRAVRGGGCIPLYGTVLSFDRFTVTDADRREATAWLRCLLLEDGTRLLAATGQWAKASAHAALYDDAPERLRYARQTQIIARLLDGRTDSALALLDTSVATEPWERAVAACLRSCIDLHAHHLPPGGIAAMVAAVQFAQQSPDRDTTLFRIRLGLTTVDLATEVCQEQVDLVYAELIWDAQRSEDAFAAREILRHEASRGRMTPAETRALTALVHKAALGRGSIPPSLLAHLMAAVETTQIVLTRSLDPQL